MIFSASSISIMANTIFSPFFVAIDNFSNDEYKDLRSSIKSKTNFLGI